MHWRVCSAGWEDLCLHAPSRHLNLRLVLETTIPVNPTALMIAPHPTPLELDFIFTQDGRGTPMKDIHNMLQRRRARPGFDAACLHLFSETLLGKTYRRSPKETRDRKSILNQMWVQKLKGMGKVFATRYQVMAFGYTGGFYSSFACVERTTEHPAVLG